MDSKIHPLTRNEVIAITGGLSRTKKLPCPSWGIPVKYCQIGAKLAKIEGSVCSQCYAKRGPISWPVAVASQQRKYDGMNHPRWVEAMTALIGWECATHFRWFDIGDLQSVTHLERIVEIARNLPHVKFWLPTHELKIVSAVKDIPANLIIRISAAMIDGEPCRHCKLTSAVNVLSKDKWKELVEIDNSMCPAPVQDNKCLNCRKCWDPTIKNIVYRKH